MNFVRWSTAAFLTAAIAGSAVAGPNDEGYLIFHTDDSVMYTGDEAPYCDSVIDCPLDFDDAPYDDEAQCQASLANVNPTSGLGAATTVGWVIAAFVPDTFPRLSGVTFGTTWSLDFELTIIDHGGCGDFQLDTGGWPNSRLEGTAITWSGAQTAQAIDVYWFASYSYYGPLGLELIAHPSQGGNFADDTVPSVLDPILDFGVLGLNGATGFDPFKGAVPTVETSWGEIKALFGHQE